MESFFFATFWCVLLPTVTKMEVKDFHPFAAFDTSWTWTWNRTPKTLQGFPLAPVGFSWVSQKKVLVFCPVFKVGLHQFVRVCEPFPDYVPWPILWPPVTASNRTVQERESHQPVLWFCLVTSTCGRVPLVADLPRGLVLLDVKLCGLQSEDLYRDFTLC